MLSTQLIIIIIIIIIIIQTSSHAILEKRVSATGNHFQGKTATYKNVNRYE